MLLSVSLACSSSGSDTAEASSGDTVGELSEEQQLLWEGLQGNTPPEVESFYTFALSQGFVADDALLDFLRSAGPHASFEDDPAFMELAYHARVWFERNPGEPDGLGLGEGSFDSEVFAQLAALVGPTLAQWDAQNQRRTGTQHRVAAFCGAIIIYYLILLCQRSTGQCRTQLDRLLEEFCNLGDGDALPGFCDDLPTPPDDPPDTSDTSDDSDSSDPTNDTNDTSDSDGDPVNCDGGSTNGTAMGACPFPDQICTCCGCYGPGGYSRAEDCYDVVACPI